LDTSSRQDLLRREKAENLGCLAATCAIQLGYLEEAIELLDLGRSVLWQQGSYLRSDLETLRADEPELADEFESIGRQLDSGNFSSTVFPMGERDVRDQYLVEGIAKERRRLVCMWEGLLERVRRIPKFECFLKPVPFCQLHQSVGAGHVVIINVSDGPVALVS
jgi:hypothetical protein